MDIRIGILNSGRELAFETSESAADVEKVVAAALAAEAKYFSLTDAKGNLYMVPTAAFGYLEIGSDQARRVGFVA